MKSRRGQHPKVSVGVDIADLRSVTSLVKVERARNKYFTVTENEYCQQSINPTQHYAARLAAKEAFLKALGVGIFSGIPLREIEVRNRRSGKPYLKLGKVAASHLKSANIISHELSISHGDSLAIAVVLLIRLP